MTKEQAQGRVKELRREINDANYHYYTMDAPLISDQAYDEKMRELHDIETDYPELVSPDSPTQRVGSKPLDGFKEVTHQHQMLSLDNVFSNEELLEWAKKTGTTEFIVQPKMDGLSVELAYLRGTLQHGATRGDGLVGEDVTHNIKTIKDVPLSFESELSFHVRGEVVIYKRDLIAINQQREAEGKATFVNPRNAAAGGLRNLDPREASKRRLRFFAFDILGGPDVGTQAMKMDVLLAFKIPCVRTYHVSKLEDLIEVVNTIESERSNFPYDIDGAVVKVNSLSHSAKLGNTSRAPRWAIALKFKAEQAETTVRDITVQVGRTGILTPVAELVPVVVGQATISRATLHNQDMLNAKNINIGDKVIIQRAGDVIPEVVKVSQKNSDGPFILPDTCPVCESKVSRIEGEAATRCVNSACPAKLVEGLKHFVSRDCMNIDGLGDKLIEQMVENHVVSSPFDLFTLLPMNLSSLDRMGDKLAAKVVSAIQKARDTTLDRLIHSLGIPMVGRRMSKRMAEHFGSMDKFMEAGVADLMKVEGVGVSIATGIVDYTKQPVNKNLVAALLKVVNLNEVKAVSTTSNALAGKVFVVTGNHSIPREKIKELIAQHGGKCVGSLSSKVNILLAGKEAGPKKIREARSNPNISIWAEADLMAAIGEVI